jgi:tripartite-type tricarboxylate transporter receptor subunit TctC
VIRRLDAEIAAIVQMPDMKEKFLAQGADAPPSDPERFGRLVRSEIAKWKRLIAESGAKVD